MTVLFVGGCLLLRRRARGRTLHLIHAVVQIPLVLFAHGIWAYLHAPPWEKGGPHVVVSAALAALAGAAYPLFLLVWFARAKIRQQVRTWTRPGAGKALVEQR